MDEDKSKGNNWSLVTIIICLVGFVITIYLLMVGPLDAKFEALSKNVEGIGTVTSLKVDLEGIKTKLDAMDQKLEALKAGPAAVPAPAAPVAAPVPEGAPATAPAAPPPPPAQ